jgi:hypothetical protein
MRHFLPPCPVAALTLGMGPAALRGALITACRGAPRLPPGALRAPRTAVDIAPVAAAADRHLTSTTGTVEQTGSVLHRQLLPMSTGLKTLGKRYLRAGRAMHGLGVRYRKDCGGRGRCRTCLNGTDRLPHRVAFVICRPILSVPASLEKPHHPPPLTTRLQFTILDGDSPRYSPAKRRLGEPSTLWWCRDPRLLAVLPLL